MKLDPERVAGFIADIRQSSSRLRSIGTMPEGEFLSDPDAQDIARSRLLTAVQAALGICYHICAKELDYVPKDYAGCFDKLGQAGVIDAQLATRLVQMARFRNRLVHLYWDTDYRQVHRIIRDDLADLETFVQTVERFL